jgi:hypothetical protein
VTYSGTLGDIDWEKTIAVYDTAISVTVELESDSAIGEHTIRNYADMDVNGVNNIGLQRGSAPSCSQASATT